MKIFGFLKNVEIHCEMLNQVTIGILSLQYTVHIQSNCQVGLPIFSKVLQSDCDYILVTEPRSVWKLARNGRRQIEMQSQENM